MTIIRSKKKNVNFTERIRVLFEKLREPALYLLVIVALIGNVFQFDILRDAALFISAALVLRVLFDIHRIIHAKPAYPRVVSRLSTGEELLRYFIDRAIEKDHRVHIRWIGMTMYNVWNTMEGVFDDLTDEPVNEIIFEVAMLSREFLDINPINKAWTGNDAEAIYRKMRTYGEQKNSTEFSRKWLFDIQRYNHMPALHGGLINDKYLFLGLARWEFPNLKAGDRPFEIYVLGDSEIADDKINIFNGWFQYCHGHRRS